MLAEPSERLESTANKRRKTSKSTNFDQSVDLKTKSVKNRQVTVENQIYTTIVGRHHKVLRLVRGEDVWTRPTATALTST